MANNLFANKPNLVSSRVSAAVNTLFDATNVYLIFEYEVTTQILKSYDPTRSFNQFTNFTIGNQYFIVPKIDLDYSSYFSPPLGAITSNNRLMINGTDALSINGTDKFVL